MGDFMGNKDRQIWSSSHVVQAPLFNHSNMYQNSVMNHHHYYHNNGEFCWPVATPLRETLPLNYNPRLQQRINWQRRMVEERMQAFFLVSPGSTSSGTGVFLPATAFRPPPKKPVSSPMILPARVVHPTINRNIHNNGTHITTGPETQENDLKKQKNKNKSEEVVTSKTIDEVEIPIEQLLPEEWVY